MKKLFSAIACPAGLLLLLFSCNGKPDTLTSEATLRFTGLVAADGCGYFLDIDGKEFKPSNEEVIPEAMQEQELTPVMVTYEMLEEPEQFSCGMMPSQYEATIKIIDITPNQQPQP